MKIAIVRLGSRPILTGDTITSLELINLRQVLLQSFPDATVEFIGNKIKEAKSLDYYIHYEDFLGWPICVGTKDFSSYDMVFCVASNPNFFGGKVSRETVVTTRLLVDFQGPIVHVVEDPAIPAVNFAAEILKRGQSIYGDYDERLSFDSAFLMANKPQQSCLFAGMNYKEYAKSSKSSLQRDLKAHPARDYHLTFARLVGMQFPDFTAASLTPSIKCTYWGARRGAYRQKKLEQFFEDISGTQVIGHISEFAQFSEKAIPNSQLPQRVSNSMTSLVIGDKEHNGSWLTTRLFEAVKWGSIALIDEEFDPLHTIFPDASQFYVSTSEDILEFLDLRSLKELQIQRELQQNLIQPFFEAAQNIRIGLPGDKFPT